MFESKKLKEQVAHNKGQVGSLQRQLTKLEAATKKSHEQLRNAALIMAKGLDTLSLFVAGTPVVELDGTSLSGKLDLLRDNFARFVDASGFEYFFEKKPAETKSGFRAKKKQKKN